MAQQLRALPASSEDLDSNSSIWNLELTGIYNSRSRGPTLLLPSWVLQVCGP